MLALFFRVPSRHSVLAMLTLLLETSILSNSSYIWKRETWSRRKGPAIKQYLSSISIGLGNSNEVTNIIFTTENLTGRLWARASVISISFAIVSLDELLFRLRCTTTNLSIFPRTLLTITIPEIRTTGGTTPIVTHCATRAEFLRHSMYEAVSLNAIMTRESQRLYRKATFSEGFL